MKARLVAATAFLLVATAQAQTTVHRFQQGLDGYSGQADTNIRGEEPDTVGGTLAEISIDASDGGFESQGLLRFDALFGEGPGQIGSDRVIQSATLTLVISSAGSGIRFHEMLLPWSDSSATFNSFGSGVQANGTEARATPVLAVGANDGNGNLEEGMLVLDFTGALTRAQAGFAPEGWALLPWLPDGTNGVDFFSAEWSVLSERPLLTVTTVPVPEPGSLALLALGAATLAWKRRRMPR